MLTRLLYTADLHLGRRSTRLQRAEDDADHSALAAWQRIVEAAIDRQVDALLIGGDLIDQENRFYQALGPLQQGIGRLAEQSIATFVVAGNHDYQLLNRLAAALADDQKIEDEPALRLVGRNGQWQAADLVRDDRCLLRVHGWSAPAGRVTVSPMDSYALPPHQTAPTVGLVHGDLDQMGSFYAPLDSRALKAQPVAGWLLGHVHAAALIQAPGEPFMLYPGSPQALDPGEAGIHGPWLIEFSGRSATRIEQLPLSSARYERQAIELDAATTREQVDRQVYQTVRASTERFLAEGGEALRTICLRLTLNGTAEPQLIEQLAEAAPQMRNDLTCRQSHCQTIIDTLDLMLMPNVGLPALAEEAHPAGELARLIRALRGDTAAQPPQTNLIEQATAAAREVAEHRVFSDVDEAQPIDQSMIRTRLLRQAELLLSTMLAEVVEP